MSDDDADRVERLAEVDAWLADLEPGCDGFYIQTALVRSLRDEMERLRTENAALREVVAGVAALKDEWYGRTVEDVMIGGWAFPTEDVTPLVEQARALLAGD